jgi:hypothetical protein
MSIVYESFMELISTRLAETFDALKTPAEKRKFIGKFYKLKKEDTTKPDFDQSTSKSAAQQEFAEETLSVAGASGAVLDIILEYGLDFEVFDTWAEDAWVELYPESNSDDAV